MITINAYTGSWQPALSPTPTCPRVGSYVRLHESPDEREWSDFKVALDAAKCDIQWVRWMKRNRMDVFRIVKKGGDQ